MKTRRLLLDAGNTRLKWAVVEKGRWCQQGVSDYADLTDLARCLDTDTDCAIASVAPETHEHKISSLLASFGIVPRWLAAEAAFDGVRNAYRDPGQLGVDRWMALIAVRQRTQAPTLVVSAGTAMTVDALSAEGVFLGGIIVPGMSMIGQALLRGVARVSEMAGDWQAFPRSTADAVQSGAIAALCGAIQAQHMRLAETTTVTPLCLLTGGDAERLLPHLLTPAEYVPALVLEGIDCVTRGSESQ
jgi:type III pantothenate kinase